MQNELARTLVRKGAIHPGIEVDAACVVNDLFGACGARQVRRYVIEGCKEDAKRGFLFVAVADKDGKRRVVSPNEIVSVMGMDPKRFAMTFNVSWDGAEMAVGKPRGRRRKHPLGYRRPSAKEAARAAEAARAEQQVVAAPVKPPAPVVVVSSPVPDAPAEKPPVIKFTSATPDCRSMWNERRREVTEDVISALNASIAARMAAREAKMAARRKSA